MLLSVSHFRGESEKKLFAGREYFCGVSRHSRVWGRHSPTSFPRGTKPQNCGFWHRGRNLLSVSRRLPLSGISVHRANGVGLSARCTRPFSLSPKIHLKGRQLPAERGLLQTFFCFCNAEKGNLATGGAENFSFHSLQHQQRQK